MKKTITYIINSLEIGGTEKQLLQLIKEIKKKFHVKILCFKNFIIPTEILAVRATY